MDKKVSVPFVLSYLDNDFDHVFGGQEIRKYNSFLGKNKLRLQNLFNKTVKGIVKK
jgi:hypothetical protein